MLVSVPVAPPTANGPDHVFVAEQKYIPAEAPDLIKTSEYDEAAVHVAGSELPRLTLRVIVLVTCALPVNDGIISRPEKTSRHRIEVTGSILFITDSLLQSTPPRQSR
jgi:hypothetical protein